MTVTSRPTPASALLAGVTLAAVAAVAAALAALPSAGSAASIVTLVAVTAAAAGVVNPWLVDAPRRVRRAAQLAVGVAFALPLVLAGFDRVHGGLAVPLELPLIAGCRNGLVGLAAIADGPRAWRRVAAASLFVALLASVRLSPGVAVVALSACAVAGCVWLAVSQGTAVGPTPVAVAAALVVGGTLAGATLIPAGLGGTARGFVPSSGGAGDGLDLAAAGLGNGPDEVAGSDHARSAGFDQSQTFMNSEQSGLYDAFLETAGEPLKKGNFEKLQMLRAKQIHWTASTGIEDYRGGRRFTLDRQAPAPSTKAESHAADALLYVDGPLPVHLRAAAYDQFDGASWAADATGWAKHDLRDATAADPWFSVAGGGAGGRTYRVRVGTQVDAALPLPALTARFHMGRVVNAKLLGWAAADVLRMRRAAVPPGTVLDADCTPFDPGRFSPADWYGDLSSTRATTGPAVDPRVQRLAREWTDGRPRGWPQVAAVVDGLRGRCRLDPAYRPAEAAAVDRTAEFLFGSRRGPDYLFATAAAVLLREVGYSTRLAGGFYVAAADHDVKSGQAMVTNRCAHMWAEVRLPDGRWAVIEATPGYAVLGPDPGWATRAGRCLAAHAAGLSTLLGATVVAVLARLWLLDVASAAALRAFPGRSWSAVTLRTVRCVEARARWAGRGRTTTVTVRRWLASMDGGADDGPIRRFADMAARAAYGPASAAGPWSVAEVRLTCAAAARQLTATRFRHQGGRPA